MAKQCISFLFIIAACMNGFVCLIFLKWYFGTNGQRLVSFGACITNSGCNFSAVNASYLVQHCF